ncbi:methylmalonyl-CoA carboxyltransferase [Verticiella sediminum]|uniref:Methylmalonyl-CoA carboxyltransferase n=1 Tax=Verticiella sediminum TaxID=1247510 RepID=A0A556AG81_9BURK|nr:carboxyl transferase domain-containing protein [Verticiella sediminum]TSH91900.1 methylmalonyl-CoA carboxyltransferase [Verticiella sediminum]
MSWQEEIDDLERRRRLALELGGPDKVERHHNAGKLTVRERIAGLADPGSFEEFGSIAGFPQYDEHGRLAAFTPSNVICGRATLGGRAIFLTGDDFTVRGGASDGGLKDKFGFAETQARRWRTPLVRLVDGTGGGGSVKQLEIIGRTYLPDVRDFTEVLGALSEVPVVALGLGSVAGMGAARVCASHYSMMVRGTSQLFAAGPPVVARTGQELTKEELGGSGIHARNGTIDDEVQSEAEAFERARRFLSYLPNSVHELAGRTECADDPERGDEALLGAVPREARKVYKMRPIVESVVDRESWFEMGRGWGKSVITGLARLDGWPVAVLASDPYHYGGAWTVDACRKAIRLVDLAQTFQLPVVHLVDIPGFLIGKDAEASGIMRYGTQALTAIRQATVPWCAIMVRKAFGMAALAQRNGSPAFMRYAWPSAQWGSLPIAGGVQAAYRAQIEAAPDPDACRAEIEQRLEALQSPLRTAESFGVEEIIDPRQTRRYLCRFANLAAPLREPGKPAFGYRP